MSHNLYSTRLYWHRGAGIAKLHGVQVQLLQPPELGLQSPLVDVDYIPEIGFARLQTEHGQARDMEPDERKACDAVLKEMFK